MQQHLTGVHLHQHYTDLEIEIINEQILQITGDKDTKKTQSKRRSTNCSCNYIYWLAPVVSKIDAKAARFGEHTHPSSDRRLGKQ